MSAEASILVIGDSTFQLLPVPPLASSPTRGEVSTNACCDHAERDADDGCSREYEQEQRWGKQRDESAHRGIGLEEGLHRFGISGKRDEKDDHHVGDTDRTDRPNGTVDDPTAVVSDGCQGSVGMADHAMNDVR